MDTPAMIPKLAHCDTWIDMIDVCDTMPFIDREFDAVTNVYLFHELPNTAQRNAAREVSVRVTKYPISIWEMMTSIQYLPYHETIFHINMVDDHIDMVDDHINIRYPMSITHIP